MIRKPASSSAARPGARLAVALTLALPVAGAAVAALSGCVYYDPKTNQPIPRGKQRFEFKEVRERAKDLKIGMTKMQVLLILGSPAETDDSKETWTYLPERKAYVVPSKALRLDFKAGVLEKFGYHAIVLGQQL